MNFPASFSKFPKARPPLPGAYGPILDEVRRMNRQGATFASKLSTGMERWMHRKVAGDLRACGTRDPATLEIGAGLYLNHLQYEPGLSVYDVVEPAAGNLSIGGERGRVRDIYRSVAEIPSDRRYDRIISIAVFEHVLDLPAIAARTCLMLNPGGRMRAGVPSEGEFLWTLGMRATTGFEFRRRYGLSYELFMAHEHVNTSREIEEVLRFFYGKVTLSLCGITRALSIYQVLDCEEPRLEAARAYLKTQAA